MENAGPNAMERQNAVTNKTVKWIINIAQKYKIYIDIIYRY